MEPQAPLPVESAGPPPPPPQTPAPRWDPPNILWYFGAVAATVAAYAVLGNTGSQHRGIWIFLVSLVFFLGAAGLSASAFLLGRYVTSGVLAASAVVFVPAVVVGFEYLIGVFPKNPASVDPFNDFVGSLFAPAAVTVAAGLGIFWLIRYGLVMLPVAIATLIGVQIFLPVLVDNPSLSDREITLIVTGAAFVVLGMLFDARGHRSPAFWWHVLGLVAIAEVLVYYVGVVPALPGRPDELWAWLTMLVVGAVLLCASAPARRSTWTVFGIAGVYGATLHYVSDWIGSWHLPLVMMFVGLGLVVLGGLVEAYGAAWTKLLPRPITPPAE